jgi:hypothetical protein
MEGGVARGLAGAIRWCFGGDVEQWRVVWHAASQVPSAGVLVEKMDMSIR